MGFQAILRTDSKSCNLGYSYFSLTTLEYDLSETHDGYD